MLKSTDMINSRYVQGGTTEEGSIGLEWWNRFNFPEDISDIQYVIESNVSRRPDLISYLFYNDVNLWWFIAQYNNILDPFMEMVAGNILYIPTKERMQLMLIQKPGSIPSTRKSEAILAPVIL